MVKDGIAESLEARGLYRRAASRWIEVMQLCTDDADREWIRQHRNTCLKKVKRAPEDKENFAAIYKAVNDTQRRMAIAKPHCEPFSISTESKR
jgi:hypothetical protein